jgi:hypothetical protein
VDLEDRPTSAPLKIDTHILLYPSRAEGQWWKAGYEIWEYGKRKVSNSARIKGLSMRQLRRSDGPDSPTGL